jgi:hypothetical protein
MVTPRIEVRLRKLERKHERPLSAWSPDEIEARLKAVESTLIAAHGSAEAVADELRRRFGERGARAANLFLDRQIRKAVS